MRRVSVVLFVLKKEGLILLPLECHAGRPKRGIPFLFLLGTAGILILPARSGVVTIKKGSYDRNP